MAAAAGIRTWDDVKAALASGSISPSEAHDLLLDWENAFPEEGDWGDFAGTATNRDLLDAAARRLEANEEWHRKYADREKYPWAADEYPAPMTADEYETCRMALAAIERLPGRKATCSYFFDGPATTAAGPPGGPPP